MEKCPFCFGNGKFINASTRKEEICTACGGSGEAHENQSEAFDNVFAQVWGGLTPTQAYKKLEQFLEEKKDNEENS